MSAPPASAEATATTNVFAGFGIVGQLAADAAANISRAAEKVQSDLNQNGAITILQSKASALVVDVHDHIDEYCKTQTGESLDTHTAALTKKFTDLGSDGSAALIVGTVNKYVTVGETARVQLLGMIASAGPQLKQHGPTILAALKSNTGILKSITGQLVTELPNVPEHLGTILGHIVKADIVPKEAVEKLLDTLKALHLADDSGKINPAVIVSTFSTIATFFTGAIGGTIVTAVAAAVVK